jgi:hypothetical protein
MIDRFITLESGAFNTRHQINQINAKRATLTRNSMTCLIVPSFDFAKPPNCPNQDVGRWLTFRCHYDPRDQAIRNHPDVVLKAAAGWHL